MCKMLKVQLIRLATRDDLLRYIDKREDNIAKGRTRVGPFQRWGHQGMQQQQTGTDQVYTKAAAFVDSDAVTPVYFRQRGFASAAIVRNGAGDLTLTTNQAYDTAADVLVRLTVIGAALHSGSVQLASATTLRVRTITLTAAPTVAAADLDFSIELAEFGPN